MKKSAAGVRGVVGAKQDVHHIGCSERVKNAYFSAVYLAIQQVCESLVSILCVSNSFV